MTGDGSGGATGTTAAWSEIGELRRLARAAAGSAAFATLVFGIVALVAALSALGPNEMLVITWVVGDALAVAVIALWHRRRARATGVVRRRWRMYWVVWALSTGGAFAVTALVPGHPETAWLPVALGYMALAVFAASVELAAPGLGLGAVIAASAATGASAAIVNVSAGLVLVASAAWLQGRQRSAP